MELVLHQDGDSGSPPPPPVESVRPKLRSPPPWSEREGSGGSPSLPCVAVNMGEPSVRFGGLLDEQSGTVSLGFHPSPKQHHVSAE